MTGSSCHGQGQKSLFHVKFLKVPKVLSMKVQLQLLVWNSTRRSLKVQSRSVNETIGQMMLYNKLKASVTSGSLVCGELFYASESPLEPERRRLYVLLLYWRSASAISHMTFAIGQQKKNQGWIELFCNYLFFLHDLEKLRGKFLVKISLITD